MITFVFSYNILLIEGLLPSPSPSPCESGRDRDEPAAEGGVIHARLGASDAGRPEPEPPPPLLLAAEEVGFECATEPISLCREFNHLCKTIHTNTSVNLWWKIDFGILQTLLPGVLIKHVVRLCLPLINFVDLLLQDLCLDLAVSNGSERPRRGGGRLLLLQLLSCEVNCTRRRRGSSGQCGRRRRLDMRVWVQVRWASLVGVAGGPVKRLL
jgi:hypothetical protein